MYEQGQWLLDMEAQNLHQKQTSIQICDLLDALSLTTSAKSSNGFDCGRMLAKSSIIPLISSSISLSHDIPIPESSFCSVELSPPASVCYQGTLDKKLGNTLSTRTASSKTTENLLVDKLVCRLIVSEVFCNSISRGDYAKFIQATFTRRRNLKVAIMNSRFRR